jgi:hypothetical protein
MSYANKMKIVELISNVDMCRAAEVQVEFDSIIKQLNTLPISGSLSDLNESTSERYRGVLLHLPNGRYASLTQYEMRSRTIEIGLQIEEDEFFHEEDLEFLIAELKLPVDYIKKIRGDFTWLKPGDNNAQDI